MNILQSYLLERETEPYDPKKPKSGKLKKRSTNQKLDAIFDNMTEPSNDINKAREDAYGPSKKSWRDRANDRAEYNVKRAKFDRKQSKYNKYEKDLLSYETKKKNAMVGGAIALVGGGSIAKKLYDRIKNRKKKSFVSRIKSKVKKLMR